MNQNSHSSPPGWLVAGCWLAAWLAAGWLLAGWWLVGWLLAGCWLLAGFYIFATFFVDSSTKMDAPMVAQEFLPRAGWLAAWFLMSLINVALRALPELDQNENKKRKRSDWTRLTKSHENKRSGTSPSRPLFIQKLVGRAPIVKWSDSGLFRLRYRRNSILMTRRHIYI